MVTRHFVFIFHPPDCVPQFKLLPRLSGCREMSFRQLITSRRTNTIRPVESRRPATSPSAHVISSGQTTDELNRLIPVSCLVYNLQRL